MGSGQGCGLTSHGARGSPTTQNGLAPAVTVLRLTVLEVKGGAVEATNSSPQGMPPAVPPGGRASPSLRGPRTPGVTVARGDLLPRSRPSLSSGQRPLSPHQCHRSLLDECEHRLYALSGVSGGGREVRNWTRQSAQLWTGEARPNPCDPVTCGCDLTWKRGLCRCDHVQNLKIRSFWLIRVGPVPLAGVAVGDKRRRQREGAV